MELVKIENLVKKYDEKIVLNNLDVTISKGKIIGLLGQNGTGKTTLIKIINGLLTPTSGKVLINNKEVGVESKKVISYLPERTYLNRSWTVTKVLDYFEDFYENFNRKKAEKLLKNLNIDINQKLSKMSKGMQEKVQLALVMSRKADLYILDEPLGGIDPATRDYILDTILNNFDKGSSILISTHLISDIERILDEVIFLKDGKVILHDTTENLREKENDSINNIFRRMFKC